MSRRISTFPHEILRLRYAPLRVTTGTGFHSSAGDMYAAPTRFTEQSTLSCFGFNWLCLMSPAGKCPAGHPAGCGYSRAAGRAASGKSSPPAHLPAKYPARANAPGLSAAHSGVERECRHGRHPPATLEGGTVRRYLPGFGLRDWEKASHPPDN